MAQVKPLRMDDDSFLRRVRSVIKDTSRLVITKHAKQRMRERRLSMAQVLACLNRGTVCESAHLSIHGDWKATIEHLSAGDMVRVAVALEKLEDGEVAVVLTVMD